MVNEYINIFICINIHFLGFSLCFRSASVGLCSVFKLVIRRFYFRSLMRISVSNPEVFRGFYFRFYEDLSFQPRIFSWVMFLAQICHDLVRKYSLVSVLCFHFGLHKLKLIITLPFKECYRKLNFIPIIDFLYFLCLFNLPFIFCKINLIIQYIPIIR